ncbi:hypothetical protein [Photobacterium sp. 53610]|uniref:hypothetical protein n=1 Tax=Photobacterium sp. 53610 TaxID=3102789 RepID=UPI002EDA2F1B
MQEILFNLVRVTSKRSPHLNVLEGGSGTLMEDENDPPVVFISSNQATVRNGGPVEGEQYKIVMNIAGENESLRNITYIGLAANFHRYVFNY